MSQTRRAAVVQSRSVCDARLGDRRKFFESVVDKLMRSDTLKRLIDVIGAAMALVLSAPVMAVIAAVIFVTMRSPVLFLQTRPGLGERPFRLIKFRTMRQGAKGSSPQPDGERLTRVGRFLRSTSMDELPEFWNVLTGSMSLVGPRPLLPEYLTRYTAEQARRHLVKPGITGWAQVNGRNSTAWAERLALDIWYVDHWSLIIDLRIIFLTFLKVLKREGIRAPGHDTMPEFTGTEGQL